MAASRPDRIVALAGALALCGAPLAAQAPLTIEGRVVRVVPGDTTPVPAVPVTLHRIGRTAQGAIDSARSLADGRFRFRLPGDTAAVYIVSARYAGIEYFGEPVRVPGSTGVQVVVYDTSSTAPVRLSGRHVIVRAPDAAGRRTVFDLLTLRNDGRVTRVAPDSLASSWALALPDGVEDPEVQDGDVSPSGVRFGGDSVYLLGPVAPGIKNLMVSYALPFGISGAEWAAPADSFDLLVEEAGATVRGAGLVAVEPMLVAGTPLRRWTAAPPSGGRAELRVAGSAGNQGRLLQLLVGVLSAALVAGGVYAIRRRPGSPGAPGG
ncbi:MAG TPA: hypothetical protein VFV65_06565 [Gemmatimonadales bacterium]|nr:hypothetical protein [Gemmatimonadales bacterium]